MPFDGYSSFGLKSRIVAFKRIQDQLVMLEATQGHIITDEIPQAFILAKFDIIDEDDDSISFDFNAGMSDLFIAEEWRGSDSGESKPSYDAVAAETDNSFLEDAQITPANELVISQLAQVKSEEIQESTSISRELQTVRVKYYLTPYNPDPLFVPTKTTDFTENGFFEVAPQYLSLIHI